ncbi:molybdate ABC transporter substrate-binding protein [Arcobacter sp. CECT 8985]|uniref:molybdate ABC transporter substrate-binding protein n=1 Tax=Arcobacter sp. CECT 8985 TaxID=1935424 RepID=UPI00100BE3A1|nr:molybdate ABC transporter substrate-binding protein [Arcobacter sp. CECT 8985]RXJ86537.1 molybdate ABC transporter substrate-binding protein [Arcobacter sp. CECT 8985]
MKKILLVFLLFFYFANAQNLKVAAGAGYKKPLVKIIKLYEKQTNSKIDSFYGNLRQVSTQAKNMDLQLVIGDKNFLKTKSGVDFKKYITIGKGKAVLAYTKDIDSIEDLLSNKIKRIAIPAPQKAIYGIASMQILKNSKLLNKIKNKLLIVATVPQVSTYLITNEVDAGIINLTSALANKSKFKGYILIDDNLYSKIDIVAAITKNCNKKCKSFLQFLKSEKAKTIFKNYGL